ncbi:MAG: nuclear transport factor 2 family protein [Chthonomonas sp.]|nr:nuclear transport factor 2 family protein [Chthonomonas sp.]
MTTQQLIEAYLDAFNRHDAEAMFALLSPEIVHDINEGLSETGIAAFRAFKAHMDTCYREQLRETVIMANGDRGCLDFICDGTYLQADAGLPPAHGQTYSIAGCAIFHCAAGKIVRIVSYYNLREWIRQVS